MLTRHLSPEEQLVEVEVSLELLESEVQLHALLDVEGNAVQVDVLEVVGQLRHFHITINIYLNSNYVGFNSQRGQVVPERSTRITL